MIVTDSKLHDRERLRQNAIDILSNPDVTQFVLLYSTNEKQLPGLIYKGDATFICLVAVLLNSYAMRSLPGG